VGWVTTSGPGDDEESELSELSDESAIENGCSGASRAPVGAELWSAHLGRDKTGLPEVRAKPFTEDRCDLAEPRCSLA
jgi:hypothetical protein